MPEPLALAALGAKSGSSWVNVRERLLANPWFDPAGDPKDSSAIRAVAQVGSFKGFGGLFIEPPLVVSVGERFLVRSDSGVLAAYALMSSEQRFTAPPSRNSRPRNEAVRLPSDLQITGSQVVFQGTRFEFPELGEFTSAAANATTLALTSGSTHAIVLVALK